MIASGGGEGWIEDYPSSADEKLGNLESIGSSLAYEDDESSEDESSDDDDDGHADNRSLTLTDISDIEQTSIQIDAVPFNSTAAAAAAVASSISLDKLIAKIKPFELGLSPASMEEHWHFESRMRSAGAMDKSCQVAINPPTSGTQEESTSTDPVKPQAYLVFPSYSLPDLSFLKKHDYTWIGDVLLSPQAIAGSKTEVIRHPQQQQHPKNFDEMKKRQMGHVQDWESLKILLPEEIRQQINSCLPAATSGSHRERMNRPRPKSCEHTVQLRNKSAPVASSGNGGGRCRGTSVAWADAPAGYILPTVPQSPTSSSGDPPPPLPKRTASLPHGSPASCRQRSRTVATPVTVTRRVRTAGQGQRTTTGSPVKTASVPVASGFTMRKTVSFGEHLSSGGFLKMAGQRRPLSLSHWSSTIQHPGGHADGSFDLNSPGNGDEEPITNVIVNLEQKQGNFKF